MQRDRLLLAEMETAASRAVELARSIEAHESGTNHWVELAALSWQFTVLGEAARQISDDVKAAAPEVPWSRAIGLRNVITHAYWQFDEGVLLETAASDLPHLIRQLRSIRERMGT